MTQFYWPLPNRFFKLHKSSDGESFESICCAEIILVYLNNNCHEVEGDYYIACGGWGVMARVLNWGSSGVMVLILLEY